MAGKLLGIGFDRPFGWRDFHNFGVRLVRKNTLYKEKEPQTAVIFKNARIWEKRYGAHR